MKAEEVWQAHVTIEMMVVQQNAWKGGEGESGEESGGQEARHRKYQKANKRLYNHQRAK
jgi:hypothetical protein